MNETQTQNLPYDPAVSSAGSSGTIRRQAMAEDALRRKGWTAENVGENERCLSLIAGGALLVAGLTRRAPGGLLTALGGLGLVARGWSGHSLIYDCLGVSTREPEHRGIRPHRGVKVVQTVHVNKDPHTLYDFWRDFKNLPRVMGHLVNVTEHERDPRRSHWVARGPMDQRIVWDAEIIIDRPGEVISWESLPDAEVDNAGSVRFDPSPAGGTDVTVQLQYDPPGGRWTHHLAHLFGQDLDAELRDDLRAFKQHMEAGETPRTHSQPQGQS